MNTLRVPIALTDTGDLIAASNALTGNSYYCPVCHASVILRKGAVRIPHFAHKISLTCSLETITHKSAKLLIEKVIRDWKVGNGPVPAIVRKCPQCGFIKRQTIPEKVEKTAQEYAVRSGRIADVALIAGDQPVLAVEIHVTHKVDEQKAGDIGVKYIELEGEDIIGDPLTWKPIAEKLNEWQCPECVRRQRQDEKRRIAAYEMFQRKVNCIAEATNIILPASFFRYSFLLCGSCHKEILVFTWPREFEQEDSNKLIIMRVPDTVRYTRMNNRIQGYWINTCHYCNARISKRDLYRSNSGPFYGFTVSSDFKEDLIRLASIKYWKEF